MGMRKFIKCDNCEELKELEKPYELPPEGWVTVTIWKKNAQNVEKTYCGLNHMFEDVDLQRALDESKRTWDFAKD